MGASLACAARAARRAADGYLVALGDMPFVRAEHHRRGARRARRRARRWRRRTCARAARTSGRASPGSFRAELEGLRGDEGAKTLLDAHAASW